MYSFDSRIRYSEIDDKGRLSLPGLINYFQDCSTFQSEDIGLGMEHLQKRNKAWILSYWQIEITRYPKLGERVKTGTFATGFKGLYGRRNFMMLDEGQQVVARADSVWAFLDMEKGRPTRPDEEDIQPYGIEPALDMKDEGRKIKRLEKGYEFPAFTVKRCHIDTNKHVNNGQYVQMAMELLPEDLQVNRLRVEYKKSALYKDVIFPRFSVEEERTVVELCDKSGSLYAIMEVMN